MSYDMQLTETFQKSIKIVKKKYPHVKDELLDQIKTLEKDPAKNAFFVLLCMANVPNILILRRNVAGLSRRQHRFKSGW